jgi:hypothetical protein
VSRGLAIAVAVVLAVAAGAVGYLAGKDGAPDDAEARLAHNLAYARAMPVAERSAYLAARRHGFKVGLAKGLRGGATLGARRGGSAGDEAAKVEERRLAEEQEAIEAAEREAAEQAAAEAEAETRYCNVPLFIDGYCPTQAEIEQENQAEGEAGIGD